MFELTPLQYEIASLMVLDMDDQRIAAALNLSLSQLQAEIEAIENELHAQSRIGIVVAMLQNGVRVRARG